MALNPVLRIDEITEHAGGQGTVDPAIALSQFGIKVLGAEDDFESSGAAHEACEMLHCAAARRNSECRFRLTEQGLLARGETHIAGQHEFAAGAAHAI